MVEEFNQILDELYTKFGDIDVLLSKLADMSSMIDINTRDLRILRFEALETYKQIDELIKK